jgi:hypothetical protein
MCSLTRGFQNWLRKQPCKGAETDPRAKFGKETVTGPHRRPKWVTHFTVRRPNQGVLRMLRLCSGCSGSSQALIRYAHPHLRLKAAVAHVRRLKRNQGKGKLILSIWGFTNIMSWHACLHLETAARNRGTHLLLFLSIGFRRFEPGTLPIIRLRWDEGDPPLY